MRPQRPAHRATLRNKRSRAAASFWAIGARTEARPESTRPEVVRLGRSAPRHMLERASEPREPRADGAFFRAWDFDKWESWASDADIGWGARAESGWSQSWLAITLRDLRN